MKQEQTKILSKLALLNNNKVNKYLANFTIKLRSSIKKTKDNDEIYEKLELLKEYIYRAPNEALRIIELIINSKNPLKPKIKNVKGWGKIEGKTHNDLLVKCIELLDKVYYLKQKDIFNLLIKLSTYQSQSIQSRAIEVLKKMAGYNFFALKKIGYQPQIFLLANIKGWSKKKLLGYFNATLEITRQLLNPSFEGYHLKDYKTFVFHSGTLVVDDNLIKIREKTIELLQRLYTFTENLDQRKKIIQVLQEATRTPHQSNYGKDMEKMVLDNTNILIRYYITIVPKADNEIIKDIEEQINWFDRRFSKEKLAKIKELQSLINSNKEYKMFRVFVGYDHKFTEDKDWRKAEEIRRNKIQEFINEISEDNYKEWEKEILLIIKNYSSLEDKGEFYYFNIFLNKLAKQKPEIAYKLLSQNEKVLEPFLIHLLAGIWKSKSKEIVKDLISKWVNSGEHLSVCAIIFYYIEEIDVSLITNIFNKAKQKKDDVALVNIIKSINCNYPKKKNTKILFVDTIKELKKLNNYNWVNNLWYEKDLIIKSLSETDLKVILENLLLIPNINYHTEEILMPIAEKNPLELIKFFYNRAMIQTKKEFDKRYDAIPFDLHKINAPLSNNAEIIIPEILKWFTEKNRLFSWQAGQLLHVIFPTFNKVLETKLINLLKSKNNKKLEIVFDILRAHQGEELLHNISKKLIIEYSKNDTNKRDKEMYQSEMFVVLSQMGFVSGEYGLAEGYKKKKEAVAVNFWKKDEHPAIKSFLKEYNNYLDKRIKYETQRADEYIELSKREFDN